MSDPDTLIQKVIQKIDRFDLNLAIPNIPKRLKNEFDILRSDTDKIIFRKLWEKANPEERKKIETDLNREIESPRKSRNKRSDDDSTNSSDYSDYDDYSDSDESKSSRSYSRSKSSSNNKRRH